MKKKSPVLELDLKYPNPRMVFSCRAWTEPNFAKSNRLSGPMILFYMTCHCFFFQTNKNYNTFGRIKSTIYDHNTTCNLKFYYNIILHIIHIDFTYRTIIFKTGPELV